MDTNLQGGIQGLPSVQAGSSAPPQGNRAHRGKLKDARVRKAMRLLWEFRWQIGWRILTLMKTAKNHIINTHC